MAVITAPQSKNNSLGLLGSLAFFGGTLTGNPFLTSLGTGMNAANQMINGNNSPQTQSTFQDAIKGLWGWVNPASGNIAKSTSKIKDIADKVAQSNNGFWGRVS